jgi:hypothetical protein
MINRKANPESMAHWMQAWKTLGRWQVLNARLSREAAPLSGGWAQRSSKNCRESGERSDASTPPLSAAG